MAITPADIEQLTFSPSKHGYDTDEVDNFLEALTGEVDAMLKKIADLKGRLNASDSQLQTALAQVASLKQQVSELEIEAASRPAPAPIVQAAPSWLMPVTMPIAFATRQTRRPVRSFARRLPRSSPNSTRSIV